MRIDTVAAALPSKEVTNDDIVRWVSDANRERHGPTRLKSFERRVIGFLEAGGADRRYYRGPGERAVDLLDHSVRTAIEAAGTAPEDIEFIIYVGVGRGWIEPSMASLVQANHGFVRASGFDLVEACASWLRGIQVAHSFIQSGTYRKGIIVNCECNSQEYLTLEVEDEADLERRLASFTVGEAATATVVSGSIDDADDFYFRFSTFGEHLQLSMIPFENAGEYLTDRTAIAEGEGQFLTNSRQLAKVAITKSVKSFAQDERLMSASYDLILSHSLGRACWNVGQKLGLPLDRYFDIHPRYGNTVSASIPLGLSVAVDEGRLDRGDHVLALVPSAGFTIGFASFTF